MITKKVFLWSLGIVMGAGLAMAKTPVEQVGESLRDNQGKEVKAEELKDKKLVAYYFSASWCPPCRAFSPELVKFYEKNKDEVEIILISHDQNKQAQFKYMKDYEMPWKTLVLGSKEVQELVDTYEIQGIPALVVVDAQGKEITRNGVREVYGNPEGVVAEWAKKAN